MKANLAFLFVVGLILGFILTKLFSESPNDEITQFRPVPSTKFITGSSNTVKKVRILCFLLTSPKNHNRKAIHVYNTWRKHCDKLIFASSLTDDNIGALGFNVNDDHSHLWGKTKLMLLYINKHFLNDYDWFFKCDDDTFAVIENLRYMLSAYSPEDPIYFGHKFNTTHHRSGYFGGGAGYVMSRNAVRIFGEKVLKNTSLCPIREDKKVEDWMVGLCFDEVGIYAGDGRDLARHERFLTFTPERHLSHRPIPKHWYWQRKYYKTDEGLDCCSNYSISYHYIKPRRMYGLYYLTYCLRVFGNIFHHPLPPKKLNFTRIAYILDQQRLNGTFFNSIVAQ